MSDLEVLRQADDNRGRELGAIESACCEKTARKGWALPIIRRARHGSVCEARQLILEAVEHHFDHLTRYAPYSFSMKGDQMKLCFARCAVGRGVLHSDGFDSVPGHKGPARPAGEGQVTVWPRVHIRYRGTRGKQAYTGENGASFHDRGPD